MDKRKLFLVGITIGCIFISMNCSSEKKAPDVVPGVSDTEITIGSSAALSGHASFLGTQYIHGSLAYINHINEEGGIHGRIIKLISYDDQYDPPQTVKNTQQLINSDRVFALFDYVGTPTAVKIKDIVHEAQIPILGFFTGAEKLRKPYCEYIFHVRDSYYAEAEGAIGYFVDQLGLKKIGVMYQEDAFGLAVLSGVQLALNRRNLEPVVTATYERGTMNVEKALDIIKKKEEVDAIVMVGTYSPLAKFIKIAHAQEFFPYFHSVSFVGAEAFGRELIEVQKIDPTQFHKIIVTQVVPSPFSETFPAVKEYRELSQEYYPNDVPNYVALEGFINAKVLVKALENSGRQITQEKFVESLETIENWDIGLGKNISYSVLDHEGLKGIYYSRLTQDGTFETFNIRKD